MTFHFHNFHLLHNIDMYVFTCIFSFPIIMFPKLIFWSKQSLKGRCQIRSFTNTKSILFLICANKLWGFLRTGYLNVWKWANVILLLIQKKALAVWGENVEPICEGKAMPPKLMWQPCLISHRGSLLYHTDRKSRGQYSTHWENTEPIYLLCNSDPFM